MIRHKSTAFVIGRNPVTYARRFGPSAQFRFLVRLAVACDAAKVDYDVSWSIGDGETKTSATITVTADKIPHAKALPKAPPLRVVADWKPRFHEAEYKLEAYGAEKGKWQPGFVIAHSSGLSLVCPSSTGEWGGGDSEGLHGDADPMGKNWRVTHAASGRGFGVELTLPRAAKALVLATAFDVDWKQPIAALFEVPDVRRANKAVLAQFAAKLHQRENAKGELERMVA